MLALNCASIPFPPRSRSLAAAISHQNLIVHRDLKPTNILVNKKGEVRLLDFGIAKLLQQENVSAAETELTRNSGRALTLRYAAPEQIEGKPITTATDVYALGLVLYELLTGASARAGKKVKKKSSNASSEKTNTEAEREALTTDILRPSRGPFDKKIADVRGHATPAEIKSTLSGDLDTIVLKALARDPSRRYPTVSAFAADLDAWLERRPITARAPSFTYGMRMFVSRQRVPVGIAAFTVLTLVAAGGYSLKQRADIEMHRARAEEVQTFMANLLTEAEPEGVEDEKALTAKGLLDAGVERARYDYVTKPLIRGEMIAELAPVYMRIGEREVGEKLLKEAITLMEQNAPADEPALQVARAHLGGRLLSNGERKQAIDMLNGVLQTCIRKTSTCQAAKGTAHLTLARDLSTNNDEQLAHARAALDFFDESSRTGSENRLQALIMTADFERVKGDFAASKLMLSQAESYFAQRRAKSAERNSHDRVKANLAFDEGEFSLAAKLFDRLLANLNTAKHARSLIRLHVDRAHVANYQGLSAPALEHAEAVRNMPRVRGQLIFLVYALRYEARALSMAGEHKQAAKTVNEAFDVLRQTDFKALSQPWLDIYRANAEVQARSGNLTQAHKELAEILTTLRANYPNDFKDHINTLDLLGAVSFSLGDSAFALACHDEEIRILAKHLPTKHPLRLRAELQQLRARMQLEPNDNQKIKFVELVQELKKHLPDESTHRQVLSKVVSSEGSTDTQKQLVLIF